MKNKKGFTMVEIVIVLAIVGIMAAMIVPFAINDTNRSTARGNAKSFFYALQNSLVEYMDVGDFTKTDSSFTLGTGESYFFILELNKDATSGMEIFTSGTAAYKGSAIPTRTKSANTALCDYFEDDLISQLDEVSLDGYFYGLVDDKLRVVRTYWSEADDTTLGTNGATVSFQLDKMTGLNGYTVGAFPLGADEIDEYLLAE